MFAKSLVVFSFLASQVYSHGVLVAVTGSNGVTGQGFGVDPSTPRDGTRRRPFQQDSSIIRQDEIEDGESGPCGRTLLSGVNDVPTQLEEAASQGLPAAGTDGSVQMTLHQVNGDGAGPYTCGVSADGTGASFAAMQVTTNVPGRNSNSRARATDFPLVATMPAGTTCTGGPDGNACLVRCMNSARAGPFGGCVAVTNNQGNATAAVAQSPPAVAPPAAAAAAAPPAAAVAPPVAAAVPAAVAQAAPVAAQPSVQAASTVAKRRVLNTRIIGEKRAGQWI